MVGKAKFEDWNHGPVMHVYAHFTQNSKSIYIVHSCLCGPNLLDSGAKVHHIGPDIVNAG